MTTNLFRALYLGQDLPDENLRDIPYPRFEVHWHVMYKCVEVGGLLGMCFFGPIAGALRGKSMAGVIKSANSAGKWGVLVMTPTFPLITEMALKNSTPEAVYDRAYRIRHNKGQLRVDRYADYFSLAGLGASIATSKSLWATPIWTPMVFGMNIGILTAALVNKMEKSDNG